MRASTIQTVLAFGSLASAVRVLQPAAGLSRRQAFDPSENTRPGSDCSVFGDTAVECVPAGGPDVTMLCIDPALGDVCCDAKWGCPGGSFCLVDGLCCPDGLDPETCAAENDVDLPDDFGKSKPATDEPTADPTESAPPTEPTDEPEEPSAEPTEPPVQAGAGSNKAGVLGAVVGLAAFAL